MITKGREPFDWAGGSALVADQGRNKYAAERIREILKSRGWKQSDLLNRIEEAAEPKRPGEPSHPGQGIDATMLSRLLSQKEVSREGKRVERRTLSVDQLLLVAKALGVPVGELLLPSDAWEQYERWRLLDEAANLRNEVRSIKFKLEPLMLRLRRMVDGSPEFRRYVENSRAEVRARLDEQDRAMWEQEQVVTETDRRFGYTPPKTMGVSPPTPWEIVCDCLLGNIESDTVTLWGDESDG